MNEAEYICFLAKNISLGLYQNNGYYILPEFNKHQKAVHFPNLNYSSKFWSLISKCKANNLGDKFPKEAVKEIKSKIKMNNSRKFTKDGISFELLETEFGTVGSYYKNIMTRRVGNTDKDFERTFFLMKLKLKNKDKAELGSINWHKRNAVLEYIFNKASQISSLNLKIQSDNYLDLLGFKTKDWVKNINFNNFTKQESELLKHLIKNKGRIVTFDETSEVLWKNKTDEKYSLEAMAKVIENLRNKIKQTGINKEIIFTKRGKGYLIQKL